MRWLRWLVPLAALVSYLVLLLVLAPQLSAQTSGGLPFDLRAAGYTLAEARAYLAGTTPVGAALYLGPIRILDTLGAILLTATLCLPLGGRGQLWFLPALVFGICDLAENVAVARMIRAGVEVDAQEVALAAGFTEAKFAALLVATLLALYALWQGWRRR